MKLLETKITINASPETVWSILADIENYKNWNPFVVKASGELRVGNTIEVCIQPANSKPMTFKPVLLAVDENKELRWLGKLLIPKLFDGEHIFLIEKTEQGCTLIQKEHFSGLLVPLLWSGLNTNTRAGFEMMNQALKERAEKLAVT